eukprot:403342707
MLMTQILYSGKSFNELGSYNPCQFESPEMSYAIALLHENPYNIFDNKILFAFCIQSGCNKDSLQVYNQFLNSSSKESSQRYNASYIEYILPYEDLIKTRSSLEVGYWILMSFFILSAILGVVGIFVEYTQLGNTKLSHEETNFNNIDIPIIQEGTTKDQLRQIMMIKDELLRNSKRLWASIILCFSYTRNLRQLFYKFKIQSPRLRHRNAMYLLMSIGICWYIFYSATILAIKLYPRNFETLKSELSTMAYTINHGGQLFGLNLIFLAFGYLSITSSFEFTTFRPTKEENQRSGRRRQSSLVSMPTQGNQEQDSIMDKKSTIRFQDSPMKPNRRKQPKNSFDDDDLIDGKYQIKRKPFNVVSRAFRKIFRLFVPLLFATLAMLYILPFLSSGPIYLISYRQFFQTPCEDSWYFNVLFTQNLLFWGTTYDENSCYPFITDGALQIDETSSTITSIADSACQYQCGPYLQIPWFRFSSFLTGVLIALIVGRLHILKIEVKISTGNRVLYYILGSMLCLISLLILQYNNFCYDDQNTLYNPNGCFDRAGAAAYNTFAPLIFNVGIIALIMPSILDLNYKDSNNMSFRQVVTYEGWRIFYKLAITMYIIHFMILFWFYASINTQGLIVSEWVVFRVANGAVMSSFILGFVFYLLIDKPIRNIDRMVLFPTKISDSFLVKKNQRGGKKSNSFGEKQAKKTFLSQASSGVLMVNDSKIDGPEVSQSQLESNDVNDESQGSDDSEDETTVTFRKAAKYRAYYNNDDGNLSQKITRGESLFFPQNSLVDRQNMLAMGSQKSLESKQFLSSSNQNDKNLFPSNSSFVNPSNQSTSGKQYNNAINRTINMSADFDNSYSNDASYTEVQKRIYQKYSNDDDDLSVNQDKSAQKNNQDQYY